MGKIFSNLLRFVVMAAVACLPQMVSADTSSDTIKVSTAKEFVDAVQNHSSGKIALCDDISFTGTSYEKSEKIAESFSGSIFTVAGADTVYALKGIKGGNVFDKLSGADIHDIIIRDFCYYSNDTHTGTIASVASNSTFSDIFLYNDTLKEYDGYVVEADRAGGLIGDASNCTFKNIAGGNITIQINGFKGGGVAGNAESCTFRNCMVDAKSLVYSDGTLSANSAYCGGICGYAKDCKIDSCRSDGIVGANDDRIGGIVGGAEGSTAITNCSVAGLVTHTALDELADYRNTLDTIPGTSVGEQVDGFLMAIAGVGLGVAATTMSMIAGWSAILPIPLFAVGAAGLGVILYNQNGSDEVGGIAGYCGPGTNIDRCSNYAVVQCIDAYSGGICGYFDGNRITNCRNYGSVEGDEDVGGIAGRADAPTISGCVNFGNIKGDSDTGGLVGYGNINNMHDCVNAGTITFTDDDDEDVGGLCGHVYPGDSDHDNVTFVRCFNYGNVVGGEGQCTMGINSGISEKSNWLCLNNGTAHNSFSDTQRAALANGVYAYALSSVSKNADDEYNIEWYQDIDANTTGFTYPIPRPANGNYTGTDRMLLNVLCDGTTTFSNRFNSQSEHTAVDDGTHHCSICGNVIATEEDAAAGITPIYTAADMIRLAHQVNCGISGQNVKAYNDIDFNDVEKYIPVGLPAAPFKGTFNGQFNRIKNLDFTTQSFDRHAAVFGSIGNGCSISGLIVDSSCSFTASGYGAAGIAGGVYSNSGATCSATIAKCGNEAKIAASYNAAGILGGVYNNDAAVITIENCYNTGSITGDKENAAICGYARKNYTINKCWNSGVVTGIETGMPFVRYADSKTMTNCYSTVGSQTNVTTITTDELSSGEICWKLNGSDNSSTDNVWYQLIGTDKHPVFVKTDGNTVYQSMLCDNSGALYANRVATEAEIHSYNSNGLCLRVSGEIHGERPEFDANFETAYIKNAGNLYWIADKLNNSKMQYNCKLMNDIVVNKNVIVYGELNTDADAVAGFLPWTAIGNGNSFTSTFDGNGHTISGLYVNDADASIVGLFGYVLGDGIVKNLGVTDCYFKAGTQVGGIVALLGTNGLGVSNCYSTGIISGTKFVGGLAANISCSNTGIINNSYSLCKVKTISANGESANNRVGALCGVITTSGGVNPSDCVTNCYYKSGNTDGTFVCGTAKSSLDFRLGSVCQLLNNGQETNFWAQELETMTAPGLGTTDVTYERSMSYRWGTLILPFEASSDGNVQYYTVKSLDSDNNLHLTAVDKVAANTPCFYRVAEGTDTFSVAAPTNGCVMPEDEFVKTDNNGITVCGLYVQDNINGSNGYYLAHDQLWQADNVADAYVTSYRAYLLAAGSSAKSISIISPEDETTAIGEITADGVNIYDGPVYNIAGQKLNAPQKHQVNIVNGKKVVVK